DANAPLSGLWKLDRPRIGPLGGFGDPIDGDAGGPGNEVLGRTVACCTTVALLLNYKNIMPPPTPLLHPGDSKAGGDNVRSGKDGKEKNVVPVSTAEYGCSNWKWWVNNTTVTLGIQNVGDEDPPFVAGSFENGYDESIATIKGRFWYVGLKKRF